MNRDGHIFLVGFMGCGKSTVGRALADTLSLPLVDLDERIVQRAGRTIPEIFRESGEAAFREWETRVLEEQITGSPSVVATGGGILGVEENRRLMKRTGVSVWLHLPFNAIVNRLGEEGRRQRPLFQSEDQARSLYDERLPAYKRADLKKLIDPRDSPDTVAAWIAKNIRGEQCGT